MLREVTTWRVSQSHSSSGHLDGHALVVGGEHRADVQAEQRLHGTMNAIALAGQEPEDHAEVGTPGARR